MGHGPEAVFVPGCRQVKMRGSYQGQPHQGAGAGVEQGGIGGDGRGRGVHLEARGGGLRQLPEQLLVWLLPCGCPPGPLGLPAASRQRPTKMVFRIITSLDYVCASYRDVIQVNVQLSDSHVCQAMLGPYQVCPTLSLSANTHSL